MIPSLCWCQNSRCAEIVPPSWKLLAQAPADTKQIEPLLARRYALRRGQIAPSLRREWYELEGNLMVCSVPRHNAKPCSAIATELTRAGSSWVKVGEDRYEICD
jgi:hypothetical protein